HRVEPFTADARIVLARRTKDGAIEEVAVARPHAHYWAGTVEGDDAGRAMLACSAAGPLGFVQTSGGTAIISGPPAGVPGPLASFVIADLPPDAFRWDAWECTADGLPQEPEPEGGAAATAPCRQLRIAVETDHELWQRFAGAPDPTAACAGYVATLFAGILQIYDADTQIRPHVSFLRLWETPEDPWDATNTSNQLSQFRNHWVANMGSVRRDIAAMLSGRGLGGGVAWLRAACGSLGYSVSANLAGSFPYPLVNNAVGGALPRVPAERIGRQVGDDEAGERSRGARGRSREDRGAGGGLDEAHRAGGRAGEHRASVRVALDGADPVLRVRACDVAFLDGTLLRSARRDDPCIGRERLDAVEDERRGASRAERHVAQAHVRLAGHRRPGLVDRLEGCDAAGEVRRHRCGGRAERGRHRALDRVGEGGWDEGGGECRR
ncbi:MAG: hypothetical protein ACKOGJ_09920, partial [Phycisphaerales bacterium]